MSRTQSHKFWKNWIPKKHFNKHFLCHLYEWTNFFFFFWETMNEQNWYLTNTKICQCYSEMKFKSEIPKFSQKSKKKKGHKTMTEKLRFCLILTLNKIKTSWSLIKPSAVSKWGRWGDEVKLTNMGEEAIWGFLREGKRGSTQERKRGSEVEDLFFIFFFCGFYTLT